jgi:hypothetical protein
MARMRLGWGMALAALLSPALALAPAALHAQTTVGGLAGLVDARQTRTGAPDSDSRKGPLVGAWVDVRTPRAWLSVTAEVAYARRGGVYTLSGGLEGPVEADYLAVTVLPTLRVRVGAAALLVYAGPAMDTQLRSRAAAELEAAFRDGAEQVLAISAGGGIEWTRGATTLRLEVRRHVQLSDAFRNAPGDPRHRSTEVLVRVGRRGVR